MAPASLDAPQRAADRAACRARWHRRDVARPLRPVASADDNTSARAALQEVTVSGVASPTGEAAHTNVERPGPPVPICLLALAPGPGRATRGGRSLLVGDEGE